MIREVWTMDNTYTIREAVPDDAEEMIIYLNQVGENPIICSMEKTDLLYRWKA